MPQALEELKRTVNDFRESSGDVNDILIEETLPDEYAEFLMSEHKEQKELHRTIRVTFIIFLLKFLITNFIFQAAKPNTTFLYKGLLRRKSIKVPSGKIARRRLSIGQHHKLSIISPVKTPLMVICFMICIC